KGGRSGAALVPGDPDKSLIIQAVLQTSDKLKMPKGGRLRPDEIEALTEWVRAGAPWFNTAASPTTTAGADSAAGGGRGASAPLLRDQAGAARVLVVSAARSRAGAGGVARLVGEDRHR